MPNTSLPHLRLVGDKRAGRVQDAGRHQPAGARLEAVRLGEVQDAVVALVPVGEALADVGLGRARLEAEERVGEVVADRVELRREVVRLRLALLADLGGLGAVLVHVVGDRPHVVEELAVDRPALVLRPDRRADEALALDLDGLAEGEGALALVYDVTQPLVGGGVFVGGHRRRAEPALVDPPALRAEGVVVLRPKFDALAGHEERARHPGRGEAQDALGGLERLAHVGVVRLRVRRQDLGSVLGGRHFGHAADTPTSGRVRDEERLRYTVRLGIRGVATDGTRVVAFRLFPGNADLLIGSSGASTRDGRVSPGRSGDRRSRRMPRTARESS